MSPAYNAIILGAGIAGLAATRALAAAGQSVLLLEAQQRVGGRIFTRHAEGLKHPIELGAEFVHGRPADLLSLIDEAGLEIREAHGKQMCLDNHSIANCPDDEQAWALFGKMEETAQRFGDMSFAAFCTRVNATESQRRRLLDYVEGFNAADADTIGIAGLARQQRAEDAIEGDRAARLIGGYHTLAGYLQRQALADQAELLLNTQVTAVRRLSGRCEVQAADGRSWIASRVICALPLGVLQARAVRFDPLPRDVTHAIDALSAGAVKRLVLRFREPWWATNQPDLHFLFTPQHAPSTWWTVSPSHAPLLMAWAGGPRAFRDPALEAGQAIETLEKIFGRPLKQELVSSHSHDWMADPFCRGAYSSVPAGAAEAPAQLARPVEDTLFFAGEHTDTTGHPGTVHGALRSGLRAAAQVLALS